MREPTASVGAIRHATAPPALLLDGLGVSLPRHGRMQPVLEDFSLAIGAGETVALVGESGSGKTTAAMAVPRLLPNGALLTGRIMLQGDDLGAMDAVALRRVRGARIGVVFQDALAALNPALTVGAQIAEPIRLHLGMSRRAAWARAVALLDEVGIAGAAARARDYPHMFSGGMRQRAMIASALACGPALLIADEPTSGLDPALREQIMALLARLRVARGMAVLLVSHDFALVRRYADRVAVLYAGRCVEQGDAAAVLQAPAHRYTRALLAAVPRLADGWPLAIPGTLPEPEAWRAGCRFAPRCPAATVACEAQQPALIGGVACLHPASGPVEVSVAGSPPASTGGREALRVAGLTVRYRRGLLRRAGAPALRDVSVSVRAGECLGVVGRSGSGKSTLARAVLGMVAYEGSISVAGVDWSGLRGRRLRAARRDVQMVFQNPAASLDPLQTVGAAIGEALWLGGMREAAARDARVALLLGQVGLATSLAGRQPTTLSGGQAQRVALARALAAEPRLLVLDEPTASLDVSTAAALLALLRELARTGLALVAITHDLAVAAALAQRIAVLEAGRLLELKEKNLLF